MATPAKALRALEKRDPKECARHGNLCDPETIVPQHRMGGMGGSKTKHRLSNLIWLCAAYNGLIEENGEAAAEARKLGIKVHFWEDTTQVLVTYWDGKTYRLDDEGRKHGA